MKQQQKKQCTKKDNINELTQSVQYSNSSASPKVLKRQLFTTQFNLSSSTSFKRFKKNSHDAIKPWSINKKPKESKKQTQQQKVIKKLSVEQNDSFTSSQDKKILQRTKSLSSSHKHFGQWIKPKISRINKEQLLKNNRQKEQRYEQHSNPCNQSNEFLQQNEQYLGQQMQLKNESVHLNSLEKLKLSQLSFKNQQKKIKYKTPWKLSYSIKLKPSESRNHSAQLLFTNKTQRNFISSRLSPTNTSKKYSNFKNLLKEQNQRIQKSMSKFTPYQQKITTNLGSFSHRKFTPEINCNQSQLLPSHYSYKSPNNYLQNYRIHDLRQRNNQEHEYFKYERMQLNLMYYNYKSGQSTPIRKQKQFGEVGKEIELGRKIKYDNFIKELKNKKSDQQIDVYSPEMSIKSSEKLSDLQEYQSSEFHINLDGNHMNEKSQMAQNYETVVCSKLISSDKQSKASIHQQLSVQQRLELDKAPSLTNQQHAFQVKTNKEMILMFQKKKNKIKRLENKLYLVKAQEMKFLLQSQRIDRQTSIKTARRMEKFQSMYTRINN